MFFFIQTVNIILIAYLSTGTLFFWRFSAFKRLNSPSSSARLEFRKPLFMFDFIFGLFKLLNLVCFQIYIMDLTC